MYRRQCAASTTQAFVTTSTYAFATNAPRSLPPPGRCAFGRSHRHAVLLSLSSTSLQAYPRGIPATVRCTAHATLLSALTTQWMVFSGGAVMTDRSKLASRSSSSSPMTALRQGVRARLSALLRVDSSEGGACARKQARQLGRVHVVAAQEVETQRHLFHAALRAPRPPGDTHQTCTRQP